MKEGKVGECILHNFQTKAKATIIKTVWYWYKNTNTDKQHKIESIGTNLDIYGQSVLTHLPRQFNGGQGGGREQLQYGKKINKSSLCSWFLTGSFENPWNSLSDRCDLVMLVKWLLRGFPDRLRLGEDIRKSKQVIPGLEHWDTSHPQPLTFSPTLTSRGRRLRGWRLSVTMAKPTMPIIMSVKSPNNNLRISFLVNKMMFKEDGTRQRLLYQNPFRRVLYLFCSSESLTIKVIISNHIHGFYESF